MSNSNQLNEILKYLAQFHPMAGTIEMYAGQEAPAGWLICDGSAVSRTEYSKLFEVIGLTYGAGDGNTTFNLPDMRGRTPIGVGTGTYTGATAHTLGVTGGTLTHTLVINLIPTHGHPGIHWNSPTGAEWSDSGSARNGYASTIPSGKIAAGSWYAGNTGGGQAHNNMQPYIVITYIISTGLVKYPEIEQEENNG